MNALPRDLRWLAWSRHCLAVRVTPGVTPTRTRTKHAPRSASVNYVKIAERFVGTPGGN